MEHIQLQLEEEHVLIMVELSMMICQEEKIKMSNQKITLIVSDVLMELHQKLEKEPVQDMVE
ncbi:hypothetical protein BHC48_07235 [Snodgrassella communis]|uniref:Uncharacterized protein n=1 Tax=Snodgrassella alvi TaxID=1196083 RepID=A0A2N9XPD6_9NEIS|nr:hypothetical protein BHC48_07235 [Snodgrassella communis]